MGMRKDMQMESPPRTIMEVYKSLPEGTLADLIENIIYMSPLPVYRHQKVLQEIFRKLSAEVTDKKLGEVMLAPFDVYLDEESNAVQPDIVVVLNRSIHILDEKGHIHGVPDLLVEILSPGNTDHDLVRKKDLYQKFGVKEYWVVEPETKQVKIFYLENAHYRLATEKTGQIDSGLLGVCLVF